MNKSFDVFLSHNSKDKPAVRELAEALRARGLKVWLDEWELIPGQPWQEALEEVIETCRSSAVLVGKDGFGPWQDAEMRGCLAEFIDRRHPVIPVLLPGAPAEPKLPFFLRRFTWVDLRNGLTEEGLDRLQWGATGKRPPDRSKLPSIPTAASEAAMAAAQPAPAEVRPAPPEVEPPAAVAQEQPTQARARLLDKLSQPPPRKNEKKREEEAKRAGAAQPDARTARAEPGKAGKSATSRWKKATTRAGVVAGALLVGIIIFYLLELTRKQPNPSSGSVSPSQTEVTDIHSEAALDPEHPPADTERPQVPASPPTLSKEPTGQPPVLRDDAKRPTTETQRAQVPAKSSPLVKDTPRQPSVLPVGTVLPVPVVARSSIGPLFGLSALVNILDGSLKEDKREQTFTLTIEGKEVVVGVGSTMMAVGDTIVSLSQPPAYRDGTLLVPLDFLQKTYGALAGYAFEWRPDLQQLVLAAREITVLCDVVHWQGITTVVLQFQETPRYQILRQPGQIDVQVMGLRLVPPHAPPAVVDPLVRGVAIAPDLVRIKFAPEAEVSDFFIESPPRIVFDLSLPKTGSSNH